MIRKKEEQKVKKDQTDFQVLSIKEENQLSKEELKEYYQNLRDYIRKRKLTNTTVGATTIAPLLKKPTDKIATALIKTFTQKDVEWRYDGTENIPDGPVIFGHTHQGILDNFAWIPTTNKHAIVLHSIKTNKLLLYAQYNTGLVLVKKGDKQSSNSAKLDMIQLLREGHSIVYFPESAWRLSPNKLHLPMRYGIIDTAKKAQVPIIPVVDMYSYNEKGQITKIHTRYAKPIDVQDYDNLSDKLLEYQEALSTTFWDLLEENGVYERNAISNASYINYLKSNLNALKLGHIDIEEERRQLYDSDNEFYLFHHINDVSFN